MLKTLSQVPTLGRLERAYATWSPTASVSGGSQPPQTYELNMSYGYRHGAPQQPAKGAALVGESPTRRIRRFTTEQPDACRCRKARGEKQSRHRTDGPK